MLCLKRFARSLAADSPSASPLRTPQKILRQQVAPRLHLLRLSEADLLDAFDESQRRGVRGGAIYDYLHLVAARKAGAAKLYTLNLDDFKSFHRAGDPEIVSP